MNLVRISPSGETNGLEVSTSEANDTEDNGHVRRPPNAFILYRRDHQGRVRAENPELRNCEICKFDIFAKLAMEMLIPL
jgi:hypothetical protein